MGCCGRFNIPSALIFCSVDREGSEKINFLPFDGEREKERERDSD